MGNVTSGHRVHSGIEGRRREALGDLLLRWFLVLGLGVLALGLGVFYDPQQKYIDVNTTVFKSSCLQRRFRVATTRPRLPKSPY